MGPPKSLEFYAQHIQGTVGRKSGRANLQAITAKPYDKFPSPLDYLPHRTKDHIKNTGTSFIFPPDSTSDCLARLRNKFWRLSCA
jgi:hypothetical protein